MQSFKRKVSKREIIIDVVTNGDSLLHIDYRDTGPGIEPNLIASEVIFEPQFSTKPSGTGLGLAIAGEAAIVTIVFLCEQATVTDPLIIVAETSS